MNEDALDLAYNLAIEEGYRKSKSDFINLLATDLDALKMSYEIAKEEGYTDSLEDFSVLIGNKALPEKKTSTSLLRNLLQRMVLRIRQKIKNLYLIFHSI